MDSLTQIVLGAAVGEVAQGKKLGNRALLWGSIAGTIPDLDVFIGKLYKNPVDELAFHRGITHSFFFAITFSVVISVFTYLIYDKGLYKKKGFAFGLLSFLVASIIAVLLKSSFSPIGIIGASVIAIPTISYAYYRYQKSQKGSPFENINIGIPGWYKLFFWSIITHPVLDCFTTYGTQIFLPFSDYRVAFNNISVADPIYTIPLLLSVIFISVKTRKSRRRKQFAWLGLILSSAYMAFTIYNKHRVNTVVEKSLHDKGISYSRYMTSPTILNNILWSTTVESDSLYYIGQYSFFDESPQVDFYPILKNRHLVTNESSDYTLDRLRWFSNDYYAYMIRKDGRLQFNDLRFGSFSGRGQGERDFIFHFVLDKDSSGKYNVDESEGGPPRGREQEVMSKLIDRIKGNKDPKADSGI